MEPRTPRSALIFHGYGATPDDHWFSWLADRWERLGVPTTVPALPDSSSPDADRWDGVVAAVLGSPGPGTVVAAHSLGCLAVLRHLASRRDPWRLRSLVLVAGFVDALPAIPSLDPFVGGGVDVTGVVPRVGSITVVRSDDDALVPAGHTDRLAGLLGTRASVVPGAGHFLSTDGVTEAPWALEAVG